MQAGKRLLSLDVFRGITIAGMIMVNNPGSWSTVYGPLLHADWHGVTPTDWIFPFFLFIVGVAIPLAIGKRIEQGVSEGAILRKIISRTMIIFGLGLLLVAFPHFGFKSEYVHLLPLHYALLAVFSVGIIFREIFNQKQFQEERYQRLRRLSTYIALAAAAGMLLIGLFAYDLSHLRILGVLQRIALVYGICSILYLKTDWRAQLWTGVGLLLSYWALMTLVPVPGGLEPNLDPETNLGAWLDRAILGTDHLWSQARTWEPEGLLSTLPAIGTGIIGILTGAWIRQTEGEYRKLTGIFAMGTILLALSLIWDLAFPINKNIWTSSFVLYTGGVALLFLGVVYWLVDVLNYQGWIKPFRVYGVNPLFAYILSGVIAKLAYMISWETADGDTQTVKGWIYDNFFLSWLSPFNASLGYALLNVLLVLAMVWILYRKRIYIKV